MPNNLRLSVEELKLKNGKILENILNARGAKSAEQVLGETLKEILLPDVGKGFANGGDFSHLPENVANELSRLFHQEGFEVMITQVQCLVGGKRPVPDIVLFRKNITGELDFDNIIAIDCKLNVNYQYSSTDPQRMLALTQSTGDRFTINSTSGSNIFGNTTARIEDINEINSSLQNFSKVGTTLENDIYVLLQKPYNPR